MNRRKLISRGAATLMLPHTIPQVANAGQSETDTTAKVLAQFYPGKNLIERNVKVVLPALAENGHSVQFGVVVDSSVQPISVRDIRVFAPANPEPLIARFEFSKFSAEFEVETRIRIAADQHIIAVARTSEDYCWYGSAHVVVTEAACLDALI